MQHFKTQFIGVGVTGLRIEQATVAPHVLPAFKPLQRGESGELGAACPKGGNAA
jgi:hypothetical protein